MDLGPSVPTNSTPRPWGICNIQEEKSDLKKPTQNCRCGLLNDENENKEYGLSNTESDAFSSIGSVVGVNRNPLVSALKNHRKKN